MRHLLPLTLLPFASLAAAGCEGCLHIEDYTLVPNDGGPTGTTGTGGHGGAPDPCEAGAPGAVIVTLASDSSDAVTTDGASCALASDARPGVDVLALDPRSGDCLARARVARDAGVELSTELRVRYDDESTALLAGTLRGGSISLPLQCSASSSVVVDPGPGATDTIFVAALRLAGSAFCTEWVGRAWTTDPSAAGALRVHAVGADGSGRVAIAGTLSGFAAELEGGASANMQAQGNAFFARWTGIGALDTAAALPADPGAAGVALGLGVVQGSFLVTGALRAEAPGCYGCEGSASVLDAAQQCPAGLGGGGGGGGSGGAGPDSDNAFLWGPGAGSACAQLSTFGSDRLGPDDTQVGFGVSAAPGRATCTAYWTGLAGHEPWRLAAGDPTTALYDTGGLTRDGFLARLDGGDALGCGAGSGPAWSVRLAPVQASAIITGERVRAQRCSDGATAAILARSAAGGAVNLHRCRTGGSCEPSIDTLSLAGSADQQLALLGVDGDGAPVWQATIGPVDLDADAASGALTGRSLSDLDLDAHDDIAIVVRTTGPLALQNVEPFGCVDLEPGAPAGTWAIGLERGGFQGRAQCSWAKRIAP